jgi:hypothetical protein
LNRDSTRKKRARYLKMFPLVKKVQARAGSFVE